MKRELFKNEIAKVSLSYSPKLKPSEMAQIAQSQDAEHYFRTFFEDIYYHESFKVMLLNRINKILSIYNHTTGGQAGCVIDVKMIVQSAILSHAKGVILCHNHPSGNTQPSKAELSITKQIKQVFNYFEISLLDHLILTTEHFNSLADIGYI
jgi:DNA repair protein RadC